MFVPHTKLFGLGLKLLRWNEPLNDMLKSRRVNINSQSGHSSLAEGL